MDMSCDMQVSDRIGRRMKLQDLHVLMTVVQAGSMGKAAVHRRRHLASAFSDRPAAAGAHVVSEVRVTMEPVVARMGNPCRP
jgi:hypothetical protein